MHTYVCGAMKREIFLYGHFGDGHCLGRYICPDDLSNVRRTKRRTGAIWLLFSFVKRPVCPGLLLCVFRRGFCGSGKQTIGAEHRFDAPYRLANTIAVFNQGKTHMRIAIITKPNARRHSNFGIL